MKILCLVSWGAVMIIKRNACSILPFSYCIITRRQYSRDAHYKSEPGPIAQDALVRDGETAGARSQRLSGTFVGTMVGMSIIVVTSA